MPSLTLYSPNQFLASPALGALTSPVNVGDRNEEDRIHKNVNPEHGRSIS